MRSSAMSVAPLDRNVTIGEGPTRFCAVLLSQRTLKAPEIILDIYSHCHI